MTALFQSSIVQQNILLRKGLPLALQPFLLARRAFTSLETFLHRPPIIVNSLPKSGTHLLLQITRALPQAAYYGRFIATSPSITQKEQSPDNLAQRALQLLPNETLGAHLYYSPEVQTALKSINALHLFIYRDPRDVIMSELFYLTQMNRWHRMSKHYNARVTMEERLALALNGLDERYPECNARLLPYAPWLQQPDVLALRYEDLTGVRQAQEIERIVAAYVKQGVELSELDTLVAQLRAAVLPEKSHTFRVGGSGKWRTHLTPVQANQITEQLHPSLEAFGYAQ